MRSTTISLILVTSLLAVGCAAGDDPSEKSPDESVGKQSSAMMADQFELAEESAGQCGASCSTSCSGGSCASTAPKGGLACCYCTQNGTPWCG